MSDPQIVEQTIATLRAAEIFLYAAVGLGWGAFLLAIFKWIKP